VARDRKRAKQRQQRRARAGTLPPSHQTRHENVQGSLEHASGEVEEFDAALIAGADGEVAVDGDAERAVREEPEPADEPEDAGEPEGAEELEEAEYREADAGPDGGGGGGVPARPVARGPAPTPAGPARGERENRVLSFLRASWAELQRVQWPDRRQVAQATAVVLGFVAIAGVYLGVADWVAGKIVNAIL
jgi:preprotein translocase SecE subunit